MMAPIGRPRPAALRIMVIRDSHYSLKQVRLRRPGTPNDATGVAQGHTLAAGAVTGSWVGCDSSAGLELAAAAVRFDEHISIVGQRRPRRVQCGVLPGVVGCFVRGMAHQPVDALAGDDAHVLGEQEPGIHGGGQIHEYRQQDDDGDGPRQRIHH